MYISIEFKLSILLTRMQTQILGYNQNTRKRIFFINLLINSILFLKKILDYRIVPIIVID